MDTRLDRIVAVKITAEEFSARFEREARAISALNHPRICTLYDVGPNYLVMEFVEGQTLASQLKKGPLAMERVLRYGVQIADALAAAHARGIVHRDLKPANIMITPSGIKVLDFGTAKLTAPAGQPSGDGLTATGAIVGTPAYMAPEQLEAKECDARTDIFALGLVLYEMATGKKAFAAESQAALIADILRSEPPTMAGLPPQLARLVRRCLAKAPERRWHSASDVKLELEEIIEESAALSAPLRLRIHLRLSAFAIAGLAVLLGGVAAITWFLARAPSRTVPPTFTQLTDQSGPETYASLSPDGRAFVYQSRASGKWDIYFQRVGGKNPVNLTKDSTDDNTEPAFSPDGGRIAFRSEREGGGIFLMGATGEDVRRLADFCHNPAWSPDGREVVCSTGWFYRAEDTGTSVTGQLFRVDVSTGKRRLVSGTIEDARQPHWSPHGYRIAYWGRRQGSQRDIWTVAASGGDPVAVTNDPDVDWNPVWSPDGRHLYFSSDRGGSMNLWRVRIDEKTGKPLSPPESVTTPSPSSGFISFTRDGLHMAYVQQVRTWNLYKAAFDPTTETIVGQPVPITQGAKQAAFPDVSPDGQWVAFTSKLKPECVYVVKTNGTGLRQLTDDVYQNRVPRWSPDGKRIAFFSNRNGEWQVWTIKPDGSGLEQLTNAPGGALGPVWSPDGAALFCFVPVGKPFIMETGKPLTERSYRELPPETESGGRLWAWSWSADGRRLVGPLLRPEDGSSLAVTAYSVDSQKYERLAPVGMAGHWLSDNRRVLFERQGKLYLVDSHSRRMHEVLSVAPHAVVPQFGFSRDRLIVFTLDATEADVWQMNFADSRH